MQLQTLQLASDGTRLVAPNLVSPRSPQTSWLVSCSAIVKTPTLYQSALQLSHLLYPKLRHLSRLPLADGPTLNDPLV